MAGKHASSVGLAEKSVSADGARQVSREKLIGLLNEDLENENDTVRNYRERVRQCEALGEYATAAHIRDILANEQEHQIDLATALGSDVADVTSPK